MTIGSGEAKMLAFDPKDQKPADIYKLMIGSVVPRPIAWVSTVDVDGARNLAPFSYFTAVCSNPPTVLFCPAIRSSTSGKKDTLTNVLATGEFVLNVVSEDLAAQMNMTAAEVSSDVDEFELAGLTAVESLIVQAPRVVESPVQMECRLRQIVTISDAPGGSSIVIGEVVRFHVREDVVHDFHIDPDKLRAVGRMAGSSYVRTSDRFDLDRPK